MTNDNNITLSRREKHQYLIYLVALLIASVAILGYVFFRNSDNPFKTISSVEMAYLQQAKAFEAKKKIALPLYDSIFQRIESIRNAPSNAIVESDIRAQIELLKSFDEEKPMQDPRFVSFGQMASFLTLYFEDVLVLKKKQENINTFQAQLDLCEIGYKDKETMLNQLKTARAAKSER